MGLFNNRVDSSQNIVNDQGQYAQIGVGPFAGDDYNFSYTTDDLSLMGEVELSLIFQLSRCWRLTSSYRAMGLTGMALAGEQIPRNFDFPPDFAEPKNDNSLLLNGWVFGLEWSH